MDMKTVKEIKLPNHLYKKLEYIKFNGAEYLYLPFDITSQYAYYSTQVKPLSAGDIMGYSGTSTYEFEYRCVSNTNLTCKILFGGGTSGTLAYQVTKQASDLLQISYKLDNGYRYSTYNITTGNTTNFVDNTQYLQGPATFNSKGFYFGARNASNDTGGVFDRYCTMLLYNFYLDSNATSSSQHAQWYSYKDTNFIPVQRLSDNVCGLYDIKHELFYAMEGTEITTNAAGPFIGEYIDGTPLEVKKIENSNGDIIWGSYDAFPYRRLEYLHFNGTDNYINPGVGTKSGYYRRLDFDLERNNVRQSTFCCYDNDTAAALRRYYVFDIYNTNNANGCRACCGNTWSTSVATSNIPLNTMLRMQVINSTYNSKPRMVFNFKNVKTNSWIISTTTIDGTNAGALTNISPYIMGCHTYNNGDLLENPTKGKVYYFEERAENNSGTILHQMYPVQRKSDGKYGLYDIKSGNFKILQGTQDNTSAGPVVDEYWNLTDPF